MSADRELLFGFLALQNDCVSREDLIAGVLARPVSRRPSVLRDAVHQGRQSEGSDRCVSRASSLLPRFGGEGGLRPDERAGTNGIESQRQPHAERADFNGLDFRKLLGRFIDVCQAIQITQRQTWINEALASLKLSIGKGFTDFAHMQQDSDLTILRDLPEFRALLPASSPM